MITLLVAVVGVLVVVVLVVAVAEAIADGKIVDEIEMD